MTSRAGLVLAAVAAATALGLAALALSAGPRRAAATPFAGSVRPPGIPAATFALSDQDGRAVDAASYRGRVLVVTFMHTLCRDTCPITAQQIRGALDQLGHDVPIVAVSVAPLSDTRGRARTFVARQHLTGRMRFLLGTRATLAPVWRQFGIAPQRPRHGLTPGSDHTADTVLLDRRGMQRVGFLTDKLTPEGLAHDIRALEREPSQLNRTVPGATYAGPRANG